MQNLWNDLDARSFVRRYAKDGINQDLALRVYTSRLLGGNRQLVLHGGGNTSVKTVLTDLAGEQAEALCVKGSGWDMADIEPAGLPALRLRPLLKMEKLRALSDQDMVNALRTNLLDSASPNPSVETLLHAFLAHKFIDHTHANAVLALSDQKDGEALCREVFGDRLGFVPYVMPGFALAKKAAQTVRQNPDVEGLVLLKHGIFTFAETAKDAYGRMVAMVTKAERRLAGGQRKSFVQVGLPARTARACQVAPILRGLVMHDGKRLIMEFRTSPQIRRFAGGKEVARYSGQGPITPDHVIRTKPKPLIVSAPVEGRLDLFASDAKAALAKYVSAYDSYFARNNNRVNNTRTKLDPMPRVIVVPGLGLFGLGKTAKDAAIAADLMEANIAVITKVEAIGAYRAIPERDIFDMEYWSLEQAKLGKEVEKPLARQIAVVTGGGSGIGAATVKALATEGAEVAVMDRDAGAAQRVAEEVGGLGLSCDVTAAGAVARAFDKVAKAYGGLDIVVSNAGAAWQGRIGEVDDKILRQSFELNFWGHQNVAKNAVRIMTAQGTGGCLLFNASKQAVNPGKDFGPYGLPKAATLSLMKQYALDYGADGIRASAVNADRIRSGLLTDDMITSRAKARGVTEKAYVSGNLLGREVTADDVANAFVALAKAQATTAAIITVDGGNIEASLR